MPQTMLSFEQSTMKSWLMIFVVYSLGGLSLAIDGPSKADISCTDNQDGTCSVSYLPVLPGDYNIIVKYNDKHIPGSPFMAKITGALNSLWYLEGVKSPSMSIVCNGVINSVSVHRRWLDAHVSSEGGFSCWHPSRHRWAGSQSADCVSHHPLWTGRAVPPQNAQEWACG